MALTHAERQRRYRERHPNQRHEQYLATRERVLAQSKTYYTEHQEEYKDAHRRYYQNHRDILLSNAKARYQRDREAFRANRRRYYENNKSAFRARFEQWRQENPERWRLLQLANGSLRRARLRSATIAPVTVDLLLQKWHYWNGQCWLCGAEAEAWDHVKPLSRGGSHCLANLRPACKSCNSSKGNRWPISTWSFRHGN